MATAALRWFERPLTYRDLDDLPENDSVRYEVIDGELHMSPFPFVAHQRAVTRLLVIIGGYLEEHPLGEVFASNTKVVLEEVTGVGPDLVYVANEHLDAIEADGYYGAPDLIVEVTSSKPGLDRVIKHRKYAQKGVKNYWIIDPGAKKLDVFELKRRTYKLVKTVQKNETFAPALFPGLQIKLARLFA